MGVWLAGCSSEPEAVQQNDPFESVNRDVFKFNHTLDDQVALPVATFYHSAAPAPVREHLHYFLTNLHMPVTFANDVLQGHFARGGQAIGRFAVNTTLGCVGIFDVATEWGMPFHQEDFGQTMGYYGVGEGPYLVLPAADRSRRAARHRRRLHRPLSRSARLSAVAPQILLVLDAQRPSVSSTPAPAAWKPCAKSSASSIDLYATTRSLYRQSRNAEIRNGEPDVQGLPDF